MLSEKNRAALAEDVRTILGENESNRKARRAAAARLKKVIRKNKKRNA